MDKLMIVTCTEATCRGGPCSATRRAMARRGLTDIEFQSGGPHLVIRFTHEGMRYIAKAPPRLVAFFLDWPDVGPLDFSLSDRDIISEEPVSD